MVYRQTARSEAIRAEARSRILRAARKLFAERGYGETSMQEIVREAKTSIGNAYFYFANKEDLLKSLLEESLRSTWVQVDVLIASVEPGPARIAVAVYANIIHLLTSERDLARIAVTGSPGAVRHLVELSMERLIGLFSANLPDRSTKEHLMTAVAVGGGNRTGVELSLSGRLDVPPRELAEFLVRWHLRAFNLPEAEIERVLVIAHRTIRPDVAAKTAQPGRRKPRKKASRA